MHTEATTAPRSWRSRMARGSAPSWACAHAPCSARSFQPPPGTTRTSRASDSARWGVTSGAVRRAHGGRAVEGDERRVEVVADVGEARQHLPGRQRVEFVEAVEEEHFASHGRSVAVRAPARQWQECHCAIDSRHASRGRPGPARRRRLRPLDPGPGLRQRARALRVHRLRGRAPGACPRTTGFALDVPRGLDALAEADTVARPRAAPGAVAAAGGRARRAARRARARRARGLDLHRRLRPRRTPACSTAAAPPRTGPTPSELAERYPAVTVDPGVLYVDEGDVLTSAGVAAGIDLCLHLVRRDHGAEVANAVARRIVVAPHRDGGQAQFVDAPLPAAAERGLAATRAWALERLREPLTVAAMARHARVQRAHLRAALPRRDGHHAAAVAAAPARRCTRAGCWRRPTSRSRTSPTHAGFGTAASLRSHFRRATATTPLAYRRSFRGSPT